MRPNVTAKMSASERTGVQEPGFDDRKLLRLLILILALNVVSAVLFLWFVNRPVYDDVYNILDVQNYIANGLSSTALEAHRNAPGPTSFLWMAGVVRLLGGSQLRGARVGVLLSWLLLSVGILTLGRLSRYREAWYAALLALLVFPHSVEAMSTVLTEGPGLMFALLGCLAWTEFISRDPADGWTFMLGLIGGSALGLSVTCRQYYLALLPAAGLLAIYRFGFHGRGNDQTRYFAAFVSMSLAVLPVVWLVFAWKGLSSPEMAAGSSYQGWKAGVGLNLQRPMAAAFYGALYLVPLTCPPILHSRSKYRRVILAISVVAGAAASAFMATLLQPGPVHSAIRFASHVPYGGPLLFSVLVAIAAYNLQAFAAMMWDRRAALKTCYPFVFSLLIVLFFVAEQLGVGGNIPFYDRYVLQIAPFLGVIAFSTLPGLSQSRTLVLLALSCLSHLMLWRFAWAH
jgi:hypothetical protein